MMLVDCQTCPVRDVHCADCMVTALAETPLQLGARTGGPGRPQLADPAAPPPGTVPLDRAERRAVSAFLAAGLVTTATANAARAELDREREEGVRAPAHGARWAV
ncbi:hypothetical protein UB45_18830 [Terrabacter sp. 28]|jgi:hypothetical protein|nr:hypothetical protein UB45_18830 [Terrabacter sp. 28]